MPTNNFQQDPFLRAKDIRTRYGISDPTLYRWAKSGKIPKPEFINGQRVWRQSIIEVAEQKMLSSDDRTAHRLGS